MIPKKGKKTKIESSSIKSLIFKSGDGLVQLEYLPMNYYNLNSEQKETKISYWQILLNGCSDIAMYHSVESFRLNKNKELIWVYNDFGAFYYALKRKNETASTPILLSDYNHSFVIGKGIDFRKRAKCILKIFPN
ncbi:MAG: hypothetical protein Q4G27_08905 [Flavobacteriaceae bacterium]|nr:hypothetical protein [Flavobacteriaceae bacterium]